MKRIAAWFVVLTLLTAPGRPSAQPEPPSLLFGGALANEFEPVLIDPTFPSGHPVGANPRPLAHRTRCSARRPVCVHIGQGVTSPRMPLSAFEQAYDAAVHAFRLPPPLPDERGGSPALDLYVVAGDGPLAVHGETFPVRDDRVAAHCTVGADIFDAASALQCVVEAATFRLDAAEAPALRRSFSAYIAWLASGMNTRLLTAFDDAQANPERSLLSRDVRGVSEAGALFFAHLEARYGSGRPGELALALFQQSRAHTEPGALEWANEPDLLDVLRNAFDNDPSRYADIAIDYAILRLFLGERSDGTHPPNAEELGPSGRVRFDWTISAQSLPRNLASPVALEPFGCTYVWLDVAGEPAGTEFGASFTWESPVRFKWAVVAVDAQGRELRRFDVPYFERGSQVEKTLLLLEGAVGLVFVGINLGGIDEDYPFDPDHEPWEPHGYELYITRL